VVLDEALANGWMLGARDYSVDSVQSRRNRVVVAFSWADKEGRRYGLVQVLRLRHGKIIDMQDFAHPSSAVTSMRFCTPVG
jgi:hypothetical protein